MTEPLIDPLQPFFRPAPVAPAPMLLSRTDLRVWLKPGHARVSVHRVLINDEGRPVEAVFTLPPALDGEVVFGAAVAIGGERRSAVARAHRAGETAYDGAAVDGEQALFLEEARQGWRVLSIAGIGPGDEVAVDIDSAIGVAAGTCELLIRPAADGHRSTSRLPDHQTPQLTCMPHAMTLTVWAAAGIEVGWRGAPLPSGQAVPIDGAPLVLHVTTAPDAPTPEPDLAEDRAAAAALAAARRIEALLAGSKPIDRAAIRVLALSANLLTAETSLVFVDPQNQAGGILPTMRKVALFDGRGVAEAVSRPPSPAPVPSDVEWHGSGPPEVPGSPSYPRPGRSRRWWRPIAFPEARAPWTVRLANWLRNRLRRRSSPPGLAELGMRARIAASLVLWSRDGVLALRSGDARHLPEAVASLVREIAVDADVIATAAALRLPPEQLAIGLLAQAAVKQASAPPELLAALFPDDPAAPPLPFQRLLARMHLA